MPLVSKCACVEKLSQLHATVLSDLHPCKEQVYEARVSQLQSTIDDLQLRNADLCTQLADIRSTIAADPFLSSKFQCVTSTLREEPSRIYGVNLDSRSSPADVYRQLCILAVSFADGNERYEYFLQDRNRDLEGRLFTEQAISMSWKHKINSLEQRLKDQLDDLVEITRDAQCIKDVDCAGKRSDRREALTKEALELLKLARLRIDGDRTRMEIFRNRIAELERELLEHRLKTSDAASQLDRSSTAAGISQLQPDITGGRPASTYPLQHTAQLDSCAVSGTSTLMRELEMSKGSLRHNSWNNVDDGGCKGAPSKSEAAAHSASEDGNRRKLIRLYSDILTLIRTNNAQAMPPVSQTRATPRTGASVHRNSERRAVQTSASKSPRPSYAVSEDRIDEAVSKNIDDHIAPSERLVRIPSMSMVKSEDNAPSIFRSQSPVASNKDVCVSSPKGCLLSASKSLPRNESGTSDPLDGPCQADTSLISSDSATEIQSARLTDTNLQIGDSPSSDGTVLLSSSSLDNESVSSDTCDGSQHDGSAHDDGHVVLDLTNDEPNQIVNTQDAVSEGLASSADSLSSSDTSMSKPRDYAGVKLSHVDARSSSVEHIADKSDDSSSAFEVTTKMLTMTSEAVNGTASVDGTPESSIPPSLHDNTNTADSAMVVEYDSPQVSQSASSSSRGKGSPDVSSQVLKNNESKSIVFDGIDTPINELPSYEFDTPRGNSTADQSMRRVDTLAINTSSSFVSAQKREMLDALLLLLQGVPVLNDLPEERLRGLLPYFKLQSYSPRAAIILAGEQPRYFYILASGLVSAYSYESFDKPNRLLRRYLSADYFGELSLINNRACTSYIIAEGHVTVHAMWGQDFVEQLSDLFPKFMERAMAEYDKPNWRSTVSPGPRMDRKAIEDLSDIKTFISKVPIISTAPNMDSFIRSFLYKKFRAKEVIVTAIASLRDFYVVYRGSVAIQLKDSQNEEVRDFAVLDPMSFVGGVSLTDPHVSQLLGPASLVATSDAILLVMETDKFSRQPDSWKTHVRTYLEQFFVDKMVERKLMQGVEKLSALPREVTHSESLSNAVLSSDSGCFSDELNGQSSITSDRSPQSPHAMGDKSRGQMSSPAVSTVKEDDDDSDLMDSVLPSPKSSATSDDLLSVSSQSLDDTSAIVRTGSYKLLSIPQSPVNELDSGAALGTTTVLINSGEKKVPNSTADNRPAGDESGISPPVKDISRDMDQISITDDNRHSLICESDTLQESDRSESLASDCIGSDRNVVDDMHNDNGDDSAEIDDVKNEAPHSFTRRVRRAPTGIFRNDRKDFRNTLSSGRKGTIGSTTDLSATATSVVDDTELRESSIESVIDETDGLSDTSLDSDVSDMFSNSFSDDSSVTPKTYDEDTLKASKDLLIATLKCKCTSLGAAFNFMDADNCGVVFRPRFYDAIEELGIASIEPSELPYLFDMLRENDREVMTVASLYRDSGERVNTAQEFCLRLQHVHGSSRVAFEKHFGPLKMSSTCAEADFLILAMNVGVEEEDARKIFKELDICGNSYVTILTMLKLMRGDWTLDVALEKEQAAVSSFNQIVGYWQNDDYESFRKEFSNPYICVFDILEYGVDVSQVDCGWEEFTSLANDSSKSHYVDTLIIPTLESHSSFRQLSPIQRRFVASLFVESRKNKGNVIISQGDVDFLLYIVLSGQVQSTYTTYLYTESASTDVVVGSFLEFDCFMAGQPSACTYKVGSVGPAVLASIEKAMFKEAVQPIIEVRSKRVPVISTFLSKVPCLEGLDPEVIERIACASVVRKKKIHETIIREGDPPEWMYVVFDGSVDVKVSSAANQIAESVSSTGLIGAEEVACSLPSYMSSALANSSTVLLIGWLASSFATAFGDAAGCIREASREASLVRSNTLKMFDQRSQRLPLKSTKTVSFSINRASNA
ncbi:cyclic nucleotide-binding domain-containing protein, putative [Babesia ovata]|uniref:Cyclic nucleotide-binding domain-containing protein, putative n=1 Tax=Babesia ovata TaxID=189622 RepID=A0A2H6KCD1_9APIC|nr:cyclic nucleotide-binding domain-containing protein, putative [Babesia ovata]GBE60660.1 cyclic nucleotide-binding domain-containing protein, putative [Babesia ovata]